MVNSISIKQVLYYYKSRINENELWSILLASLQDQYRKFKIDPSLCAINFDISSDTILLQSDGEINIISNKEFKNSKKFQGLEEDFEKKFINAFGCFLSYLIKLNDNSIVISDELRSLVAYMVNEDNEITFGFIFEETYKYSSLYLDCPYQKYIKKLFEKTLQKILDANQRNELNSEEYSNDTLNSTKSRFKSSNHSLSQNDVTINRTSGDGQSNPDLSDSKAQETDVNTVASNVATLTITSDFPKEQKKFLNLIEKIKKRKLKLKQLRSQLNINIENDDDNSEFDDLHEIVASLYNNILNASQNQNETTTNHDESNTNSKLARANDTMNSSLNNISDRYKQIPTKKFYDIRRIPPLLKFDDPLENIQKDAVHVTVKLITESKFEFKCSPQSTCKQIFEYIIAYLDLAEQNLFGLFIYCDNEYYFVDLDEKLNKVITKWRRKDSAKDSIELYLKIKIYLTDINYLHDPLTLQFYYWELRRQFTSGFYCDINDDKISPTDELPLLFQLAVLAFHAEGGELNELNYLYDNYIPERFLTEVSLFEIQLGELYKSLQANQTAYQSLVQFTNLIIEHKNYGYHFFQYLTSGNSSINTSNNSLSGSFSEKTSQNYIGVSLNGISIYKPSQLEEHQRPQNQINNVFYKWQQIEKLIVERKKILLQLRPNQEQSFNKKVNSKYLKIFININSEKKAKSIVKLSQSLSRFSMAIEQRYLNKINIPTTLFEAYSDIEDENPKASFSQENLSHNVSANNLKDRSSLHQSYLQHQQQQQQQDDTYLLKDILSVENSSYIKIFEVKKTKKQRFGIILDDNKTFNCKSIKQIINDTIAKQSNLAVGDLILCINNEIKFNEMSAKNLESYLDNYNGSIRILLLSKENVEKLLAEQSDSKMSRTAEASSSNNVSILSAMNGSQFTNHTSPGEVKQQQIQSPVSQVSSGFEPHRPGDVIFEESEEAFTVYNTNTQLITKMTNSQLFNANQNANSDNISIRSSIVTDSIDSIDVELMNKLNQRKSIKNLFSLAQITGDEAIDGKLSNNGVNTTPGSASGSSASGTINTANKANIELNNGENFVKIDVNKIFKVILQKNSNNELGFTVTKLPNGYSCIKEILHDPALSNRFIKTGDMIVNVNGSSTKSLSHRDVVSYLRIADKNVEFDLYRPDADIIIPYLNQRKSKHRQMIKALNKYNEQEEDDDEQLIQKAQLANQPQQIQLKQDEQLPELDNKDNQKEDEDETTSRLHENINDDTITENTEKNEISEAANENTNKNIVVPLLKTTSNQTSRLIEFEYSMKDFLSLNLILSTEKLDENDDESSLISNLNQNNKATNVVTTIPTRVNNTSGNLTTLLYVKSIKNFDNENEIEKNLQVNDLIIKFNDQFVTTLEEFKLILYNLNKKFQLTNQPQIVKLIVKRRYNPVNTYNDEIEDVAAATAASAGELDDKNLLSARFGNTTQSLLSFSSFQSNSKYSLNYNNQTQDLNAVNITVATTNRRLNGSIDNLDENGESIEMQNYRIMSTSSNYIQFFFPLYSNENIITEEYLQAYNNFNNIDVYKLENLFEAIKTKVLSKTQDYIQEFKMLKAAGGTIDSSKIANYSEENRSKNRYRNVVPYDFNRVKLMDTISNNDYINASHICLPLNISQKNINDVKYVSKFITAQPPLNNTINDFLAMVWEQNIHLIVKLLTNDEINKLKCPKYWPTKEAPTKEFLPFFQLTLISSQSLDDHIFIYYCEFHNLKTNQQRNIFICQYTDEIQNTQSQSNELTYFNQFNRLQTFMNLIHIYHQKGPLLVYCLTGLGRTGLFLCIYYSLTQFKCDFYSNSTNSNFIFDTVKQLRSQRYGVIQTKEQYKFCYTFFLQLFSQKLQLLSNQLFQQD